MKPVRLSTGRLVLDAPTRDDVQLITKYCQDPLIREYTTVPWPYLRQHAEQFIERVVGPGWADDSEYTWALRDADGAPLKGAVGWRRDTDEIGYWLGGPHRGNGYMAEAVGAVCDWLFSTQVTAEVYWEAAIPNRASLQTARRAGFRYTGEGPVTALERVGRPTRTGWHAVLRASDDRFVKDGWPT